MVQQQPVPGMRDKLVRRLSILTVFSLCYAAYLFWEYVRRFWAIDKCLDAGGAIGDSRRHCTLDDSSYLIPDLYMHQNFNVVLLAILFSLALLLIRKMIRSAVI